MSLRLSAGEAEKARGVRIVKSVKKAANRFISSLLRMNMPKIYKKWLMG